MYEASQYCCHIHENSFVRNLPLISTLRRHHTARHNQGIMMKYNMKLMVPIAPDSATKFAVMGNALRPAIPMSQLADSTRTKPNRVLYRNRIIVPCVL